MARTSLVEMVIDHLLDRIASGEFPPGSALPGESELAAQCDASRLTVREAVKVLASQQVLRSEHGRGTYVNPVRQWISLDALMRLGGDNVYESMIQLIEVRSMIEVGAAELFAARCQPEDLKAMEALVQEMQQADATADVPRFVTADMGFHARILEGCGNPFVPATYGPIARALRDARVTTSSVPEIRAHAITEHGHIINALRSGSPRAAAGAMRAHLDQTTNDALRYLAPSRTTSSP